MMNDEKLYTENGEELGRILGMASCREDGRILLCDILFQMTVINPLLKAIEIQNLIFTVCPEGGYRSMKPKGDEFVECMKKARATRMKDIRGYRKYVDAFDRGEVAYLSADFVEKYLGVPINRNSSHLTDIEFVVYAREEGGRMQCYMTLLDQNLKEAQGRIHN